LDPPAETFEPWAPVPPARRRFQHRYWLHALLFLLTVGTTTLAGGCHYASYRLTSGGPPQALTLGDFIPGGFWYSLSILAILGAHEMGHYLMCRWHRIDATLPYFLPIPLPLTGTIGAFIRIREPFRTRRVLFDIGVAGPIAGFVVLVPMLFLGIAWSPAVSAPSDPEQLATAISMGEPLLFQLADRVVWGEATRGWVNMHPLAFAAWFGLIATALNLMPFGQLDGGHIAYAVLGRRSTIISLATVAVAVALTFVSSSWYLVTGMMLLMLLTFGPRHPSVLDEQEDLDPARIWIAVAAAVILIICFTPAPIEPYRLLNAP
jgi:membrane-associated protease RseP (regulator of RpoE activity)